MLLPVVVPSSCFSSRSVVDHVVDFGIICGNLQFSPVPQKLLFVFAALLRMNFIGFLKLNNSLLNTHLIFSNSSSIHMTVIFFKSLFRFIEKPYCWIQWRYVLFRVRFTLIASLSVLRIKFFLCLHFYWLIINSCFRQFTFIVNVFLSYSLTTRSGFIILPRFSLFSWFHFAGISLPHTGFAQGL